nr:TonB-dependent receptor [Aquimarina sp. RZ0]
MVFETYNGERLPDYHRLDLTADYNFYLDKAKKIKTKLGFTLQNLTNQRNVLSRDFRAIESFDPDGNSQLNTALLRKIDRVSIGFTPNFILIFSI